MKTRYKLYKDGKKWVVGAIAVAGIASGTALTNQVSADTTANATTSQTNSDESSTGLNSDSFEPKATTNDNTSTTSGAANTSEASTTQSKATTNTAVTSSAASATSTIPTSVASNVTQSEAKQNIDQAQGTVQSSADSASQAGVKVTQGDTKDVTLTDDNAAKTTTDVLTDLNAQDEAIKQAEATQKANEAAKSQADEQQAAASKQGQADLQAAHDALDAAIAKAQESGVKVSTVLSEVSPEYQSLKGLTGQDLLTAMANNIKLYQASIAKSVASETTDTTNLAALTAEYNQAVKDYETATANRNEAQQTGSSALADATSNLQDAISDAKKAGVTVNEIVSQSSPAYKDLKGLTGKDLLDAMAYNIGLYNKSVNDAVTAEKSDTANLQAMTAEYQAAVAKYNADKEAVDKANADKKAAFDKAVEEFKQSTNVKKVLAAKTQTDQNDGTLKTFMTASINQSTGEFTLTHDMNNNGTIIGHGYLKGKILYNVTANDDGTITIKVTGIQLYSYSYNKITDNTNPNKNINFHVYDANKNQIYVKVHDGSSSFTDTINKTFSLNKVIVLSPGQTSDSFVFMFIDDNWDINTHGQVSVQFTSDKTKPVEPTYEPEPDPIKPGDYVVSVTSYTVDALPEADAPQTPETTVTKHNVTELPNAEDPKAQEVPYHLYNVSTTPKQVTAPVKATPMVEAALPETSAANYDATQVVMASLAATLMAVGLVGAKKRYRATLKNNH